MRSHFQFFSVVPNHVTRVSAVFMLNFMSEVVQAAEVPHKHEELHFIDSENLLAFEAAHHRINSTSTVSGMGAEGFGVAGGILGGLGVIVVAGMIIKSVFDLADYVKARANGERAPSRPSIYNV